MVNTLNVPVTQFGSTQFGGNTFGGGNAGVSNYTMGNIIVCLNDPSSHGGFVQTTGGVTTVDAGSRLVAVVGAEHSCPIPGHGVTPIANTIGITKTYAQGVLVLVFGDQAGCGAVIQPPSTRKVIVNT